MKSRKDNRIRMAVDRKLAFFTVRHEIHQVVPAIFTGQPRVIHRWPQSMYTWLESSGMKTRR